ncbi:PilZ domain-containing protein [Veronia nyctiphanis]|nr:PilZ domain-containing protein [Veronia nyctiphanis]
MSQSSVEVEKKIESLLPYFNTGAFGAELEKLSTDLDTPTKFFIRSEISRRMKPCDREIDLRGKVPGDVRKYKLHGKICWVDDLALNHYRKRIKLYKGHLTLGLWEELQPPECELKRLKDKKGRSNGLNKDQLAAHYFENSTLFRRSETRYKVFSLVTVLLDDGSIVHGKTLDLSPSGIRVKAASAFSFRVGNTITVRFTQLAEESGYTQLAEGIKYQIIRIKKDMHCEHFIEIGLKAETQIPAINDILAQRSRQIDKKLSTQSDHELDAIQHAGMQLSVVNGSAALPIFLEQSVIRYAMLNSKNKHIWDYWHDGEQHMLNQLLSPERLSLLAKHQSLHVFTYTQTKGTTKYFVTASSQEVSPDLHALLCQLGASSPTWRVFRLDLNSLAQLPPSNTNTDRDKLSHIITIHDLTFSVLADDYRCKRTTNPDTSQLSPFTRKPTRIDDIELIETDVQSPFAALLRHYFAHSLTSAHYFLQKSSTELTVYGFLISSLAPLLNQILKVNDQTESLTLKPIFHRHFYELMKNMMTKKGSLSGVNDELYVAILEQGNGQNRVVIRCKTDLKTTEERANFVKLAKRNGAFIAVRNHLYHTPSLFTFMDRNLWGKLQLNASKKRGLQHSLEQVCLAGTLTDITEEVLIRFNLH